MIVGAKIFGLDPFGFGVWPGLFAIIGGVARTIYMHARPFDDGEDGAIL